MTTDILIHSISDIISFTAYATVALGFWRISRTQKKIKKALRVVAVLIISCGLYHLCQTLYSYNIIDSYVFVAASLVSMVVGLWTAWFFVANSHTLKKIPIAEDYKNQIAKLFSEYKHYEKESNTVTRLYSVLLEIYKVQTRSTTAERLFQEVGHALCLFAQAHYVWVAEWKDAWRLVYTSPDCPSDISICDAVPPSEFFDGQDMVVETIENMRYAYFRIDSKSDHALCVAFDSNIDNRFIKSIVAVADCMEYVLRNNDVAAALQQSERERLEQKTNLSYLESHDKTTGLPNRDCLTETAKLHLLNGDNKLAIVFVDFHNFSDIVTSEGHYFGDAIIIDAVSRLYSLSKKTDCLGRFGQQEFVIVSKLNDNSEATKLAEKIVEAFETPFALNGKQYELNVSIGIAFYPSDSDDWRELVTMADKAQAAAKSIGKNSYKICSALDTEAISLEKLFRRDLDSSNMRIVYQPQVNIFTNEIVGVEALSRWECELGLIDAPTFIQMAEYSGLITEFSDWVLEQTCKQWRSWVDDGMPLIKLSINLSSLQLRDCSIIASLERVLEKYRVPASYICLEVSESVLVKGLTVAEECIDLLRNKGIRVVIDDFGSGYSSLSYLQHFKIDELKIDNVFLQNAGSTPAIAKNIFKLADDLHVTATAEGVETADQKQMLKELGCTVAQGRFFYPPMKPEQILPLIKESRQ